MEFCRTTWLMRNCFRKAGPADGLSAGVSTLGWCSRITTALKSPSFTVSVKVIDGRSKLNALRRSLVRRGSAAAPICSWRTGLRHSQYLPRWRSENSTPLTGEGAADLEIASPAASSAHRKIAQFLWTQRSTPKKFSFSPDSAASAFDFGFSSKDFSASRRS